MLLYVKGLIIEGDVGKKQIFLFVRFVTFVVSQ